MVLMNTKFVVTAAVLLLLAAWRALQLRRAWAGRPIVTAVHRTMAAQALILAGAAIVVGAVATTPAGSARPGPVALTVGALGIIVVLAGGLAAVLTALVGRPRFLIPPQSRTGPRAQPAIAAGGGPGAAGAGAAGAAAPGAAGAAGGGPGAAGGGPGAAAPDAAGPSAPTPSSERGLPDRSDEDALLTRAVASFGPGAAAAAGHLRKNVGEIKLTVPLPPDQAAARARQVIADLGALQQPGTPDDAGAIRVVGIIGAGALKMNPAVVTVVISPADHASAVVVRGAAREGLIKQRAGEDAARRTAAGLG
jgi:hypothetical protein